MSHLKLSESELQRLKCRIEQDHQGALADHAVRIERFKKLWRLWRGMLDAPEPGDEAQPNYQVPLLRWFTLGALAKTLQSLLGDDAQVIAEPVGPTDQRSKHKIERFINWRVFKSMNLVMRLALFVFRAIVFGRSHVYMPYERRTIETPDGTQVVYEGPGFYPIAPDDFILPAQDVETIHDFPWVIRRYRQTPQQLLIAEAEGRMFGIEEDFENILRRAQTNVTRDQVGGDQIKREEDDAEGVMHEAGLTAGGTLTIHEWYGGWRLPKGKGDVEAGSVKGRELRETELVVRFCVETRAIYGVQRLMDLYPKMEHRRPFEEAQWSVDGTYWVPGYGEWLQNEQAECTDIHNKAQKSAELAAAPSVFYEPASGFNPQTFKIQPSTAIPVADASKVNVLRIQGDLQGLEMMNAAVKGNGELVTGYSDATLGRTSDRPNQPRTASGQQLLAEAGNVRAFLDIMLEREAFKRIFRRIWDLDCEFSAESLFFRVTEEEAKGLFDTRDGGATMTAEEFQGRYDFDIKFATSYLSRESEKARQLQLYQLDLLNPLIAQNPNALWHITERLHSSMGDDNFTAVCPKPPDLGQPKDPSEEWTLMLQGEDVEPNPLDNDDLHLTMHYREMAQEQRATAPDEDAIHKLAKHIVQHQQQKRTKMLMQALAGQAVQGMHAGIGALANLQQQQAGPPGMGGGGGAAQQMMPMQPPLPVEPGGPVVRGPQQQ